MAGAVLFLSSGVVLLVWRQHLRRLEEIDEARRDLRDEAEELRRLLEGEMAVPVFTHPELSPARSRLRTIRRRRPGCGRAGRRAASPA